MVSLSETEIAAARETGTDGFATAGRIFASIDGISRQLIRISRCLQEQKPYDGEDEASRTTKQTASVLKTEAG
jgi:hypothetical protein